MPRSTPPPNPREDEAELDAELLEVDELDPDDPMVVRIDDDDDIIEIEVDDDELAEELDLDDLQAMEGPDA